MASLKRIGFTGGGTGGHVYPIVAVIEALKKMDLGATALQLHYFGEVNDFSKAIIKSGALHHNVFAAKFRRYFSLQNIIDIPKIFIAFIQALWKLWIVMPDVLFSKGGPGALPVVLAARFYFIPVVIHESDSTPGVTNLVSSWFASRICITFEAAAKFFAPEKTVLSGAPVRSSLLAQKMDQGLAKERLGFDPAKPLLFVTGGSQGAQQLNDFVVANLPELLPVAQIYHQTGSANFLDIQKLAPAAHVDVPMEVEKGSRYKFVAYLDGAMTAEALSAADVVLGRAGSGTIGEAAAFGRPMILVPLPEEVVGTHQRDNAYAMQAAGAAFVIEGENLAPSIIKGIIQKLFTDRELYSRMSAAASKFNRPEAAKTIAETVTSLV